METIQINNKYYYTKKEQSNKNLFALYFINYKKGQVIKLATAYNYANFIKICKHKGVNV